MPPYAVAIRPPVPRRGWRPRQPVPPSPVGAIHESPADPRLCRTNGRGQAPPLRCKPTFPVGTSIARPFVRPAPASDKRAGTSPAPTMQTHVPRVIANRRERSPDRSVVQALRRHVGMPPYAVAIRIPRRGWRPRQPVPPSPVGAIAESPADPRLCPTSGPPGASAPTQQTDISPRHALRISIRRRRRHLNSSFFTLHLSLSQAQPHRREAQQRQQRQVHHRELQQEPAGVGVLGVGIEL